MRLIHTGDWHIGKSLNDFSLIEDQKYFLEKLKELLITEKADGLIVAGDIFDRSVPPADAVTVVDEFFSDVIIRLKIPIFAISGNHDSGERLAFANSLYRASGLYMESIYKGEIAKYKTRDEFGNINFYLLPFSGVPSIKAVIGDNENVIRTADDAFKAIISKENICKEERNILITHGFFGYGKEKLAQGETIINTCELSDSEAEVGGVDICDVSVACDFDYVALGHIHSPQKVRKEHIRYAGSLLKYSVSEAAQKKSVTIVDIGKKNDVQIIQKQIKPLRNLVLAQGEFEYLIGDYMADKGIDKNDYIFFNITGRDAVYDAMAKLRSVYNNVLGLKFVDNNANFTYENNSQILQSKTTLQLFDEFYSAVTGNEITQKEEKIISDIIRKIEAVLCI